MPPLRMGVPDALYWAVLGVFGLTPANAGTREFRPADVDAADAQRRLDALRPRLLAAFDPRDHAACVPEVWTRRKCLLLLRRVLATRDTRLRSRVRRAGGKCARFYSLRADSAALARVVRLPRRANPMQDDAAAGKNSLPRGTAATTEQAATPHSNQQQPRLCP